MMSTTTTTTNTTNSRIASTGMICQALITMVYSYGHCWTWEFVPSMSVP